MDDIILVTTLRLCDDVIAGDILGCSSELRSYVSSRSNQRGETLSSSLSDATSGYIITV